MSISINDFIPPWTEDALCSQTDPEAFFPKKGAGSSMVARARAICDICPVKQDCLETALSNGIAHGVWGGTTGRQRRGMPGWVSSRPTASAEEAA